MRFTLAQTGHPLALTLTFALFMLTSPRIEAKRIFNKIPKCNENCKVKACGYGQTCEKISHPGKGYDCFECKKCENLRNHNKTLMPNEVYELNEECLHLQVTCGANTDPPKSMALKSIGSPENTEFSGIQDFFGVWGALGVSVVVNLLLLSMAVNNCRRKSSRGTRRDKVYDVMMDGVEMQQLK